LEEVFDMVPREVFRQAIMHKLGTEWMARIYNNCLCT